MVLQMRTQDKEKPIEVRALLRNGKEVMGETWNYIVPLNAIAGACAAPAEATATGVRLAAGGASDIAHADGAAAVGACRPGVVDAAAIVWPRSAVARHRRAGTWCRAPPPFCFAHVVTAAGTLCNVCAERAAAQRRHGKRDGQSRDCVGRDRTADCVCFTHLLARGGVLDRDAGILRAGHRRRPAVDFAFGEGGRYLAARRAQRS